MLVIIVLIILTIQKLLFCYTKQCIGVPQVLRIVLMSQVKELAFLGL